LYLLTNSVKANSSPLFNSKINSLVDSLFKWLKFYFKNELNYIKYIKYF